MGWRSIRVCLEEKDLFKDQIKALLAANEHGNLRIMFPMISSLSELKSAKEIYRACLDELHADGIHPLEPELGVMIEVPSAVMMAEEFAREVDFFSIGTNDLIQFTLAVDRTNEHVAKLYEPHNPAVLRMIDRTVRAAHKEGIPVSCCGEMVSDPLSTLILVGLGVDELSMTPWSILECKKIIRSVGYEEVRKLASEVLRYHDAESVNYYLRQRYQRKIADLGISSLIISQEFSTKKDRGLVRVKDQIVNLGAL
jgi:phosphotransferase system enzyme I (PtsI)